jgi:hypothetical protein
VANKKLDSDLVASRTQSLLNARRDLLSEMPILAQVIFFLDLGGYAGAVVANLDFDAVAEILCVPAANMGS